MSTPVKMDSRKFLGQINNSAQAKVAFFEERVQQLGKHSNKNWRLAALNTNDLYIEDLDTHNYLVADHSQSHGKTNIANIRPVQIVEGQKKEIFEEASLKLINAIESNNQKEMSTAFARLQSSRFSSRVVPQSGVVRCRDNVLRHINITSEDAIGDVDRSKLVEAIVDGLRDKIIVEDGHVVAGCFGQDQVRLPVTKWGARKLVARRMRDAASNAYWSEGFQNRIYSVARLVSEAKIEEAVKSIGAFLDEKEEFCLLTNRQVKSLIENTMAAKAVFNQQICEDVATLFHRTNLRVNKHKIIDEWRNVAKKSANPALAENVIKLESSKNFEASYDKFLKIIFEAISNREVAAEALATTLNVLRDKTPKIKESHDLSSKLNGLINRLKQRNFDDAAIYEAEDLIATIQEELGAADTLSNFDQVPGDFGGGEDDGLGQVAGGAGGAPPVININSPLIQIGGSSAGGAGGAAPPPPDMSSPDEEGGEDPDLDALLNGGGEGAPQGASQQPPPAPPAGGGAPPAPGGQQPIMQSLERDDEFIVEHDPYAVKTGEKVYTESVQFFNYGAPVITNDADLNRITNIMKRLAVENKLSGRALSEHLDDMAKAGIKAIGLVLPAIKLTAAVEQVTKRFVEEWEKPWLKDKKDDKKDSKKKDDTTDDEGEEDEGVAEDQFKIPLRKPRGMGRSNYAKEMPKKTTSESITWGASQSDAISGKMNGVNFIFDHGGSNEDLTPVILSEDGAIEIPIPAELYDAAFAAANMADGDGKRFVRWLSESIEQLRPISSDESRLLDEAMAKITTGPDGTLSVEVSDDVSVGSVGDEMGGEEGGMGGEMGMDGEMGDEMTGMDDEMSPVDATETGVDDVTGGAGAVDEMGGDTEESMPDFEDTGEEMVDQPEAGAGAGAVGAGKPPMVDGQKSPEEDGVNFEDRDVTAPPSSKFTTHVGDNKRKMPEPKLPGKTKDRLDAIGPDLKTDDGSGVNPPVARKGSDD